MTINFKFEFLDGQFMHLWQVLLLKLFCILEVFLFVVEVHEFMIWWIKNTTKKEKQYW